ncbi:MAG: peptide deformylase [Ignavibacteriaceae bacterium]
MTLLPITLIGDKILRRKASAVKEVDVKTIELIRDMFETMRNANGIGLAANQVGADKSIFIIDISVIEGYEELKPMVFINPKITYRSEKKVFIEEGCLSIPDIRAEVERPETIKMDYQDTDLKELTIEAKDLLGRLLQHEYDHLQGILFTDLISDEMKKKLKRNLSNIKQRNIEFQYPVTEHADYQMQL